MSEQWEEKLAQVLGTTHPPTEPGAGWERDAVSRMEKVRPVGRQRRWVAAAAVVALIGLGFVPVPMGKTNGMLSRAVAAANGSVGTHLTGRIWGPAGEWRFEQWYTQEGFRRFDLYDGEKLVQRWLYEPGVHAISPTDRWTTVQQHYQAQGKGGEEGANECILSPIFGPGAFQTEGQASLDVFPETRAQSPYPNREELSQRFWYQPSVMDVQSDERMERTLWGEKRVIVEVHGRCKDTALALGNFPFPFSSVLHPGEEMKVLAVVDPQNGAILAFEQYQYFKDQWKMVFCVDSIESGVEFGPEVEHPAVPAQHTEITDDWWGQRLPHAMAAAESEDWRVTVHSVDRDEKGDLYVTISRTPKGDSCGGQQPLMLSAVDDGGARYTLADTWRTWAGTAPVYEDSSGRALFGLPECHARVKLVRASGISGRTGGRLALTVANGDPQQVVVLDLPMPSGQAGDDLIEGAIHKTVR